MEELEEHADHEMEHLHKATEEEKEETGNRIQSQLNNWVDEKRATKTVSKLSKYEEELGMN